LRRDIRHRRRLPGRRAQKGVALIIALILVALATILATKLSFDATQGEALPSDSSALMAEISRLDALLSKLGKLVPFFDQSHGNASNRGSDGNAGIHHGHGTATHRGH